MKGTVQYFPVVLFMLQNMVVSTCKFMGMQTTDQYFPVVLFITLYRVVLTFEPVDEILMCDH